MYKCNRCNKTFQDEHSAGVENIFGRLYCVNCGEQLSIISDGEQHASPRIRSGSAIPTMVNRSDNSVTSNSNSNNTTITNIYKGNADEKIETKYGIYKRDEVSQCKSCRDYVPKNYFVPETGVCQDCMVEIQMKEGDGALSEGLYEEAKDCYEKVLRSTYGNEERRQELMFKLGQCYFELRDGKKAVGYFAKTKDTNVDSIYYLGLCSENGIGKEQNAELALKYYVEAAKKGSILAARELEKREQESIESERLRLEEEESSMVEEQTSTLETEESIDSAESQCDTNETNNIEPEVMEDAGGTEGNMASEPDKDIEEIISESETNSEDRLTEQTPAEETTAAARQPQVSPLITGSITNEFNNSDRRTQHETLFNRKKGTIILGAAALAALIIVFFFIGNKEHGIEKIFLNIEEKTILVDSDDTLTVKYYPDDAEATFEWKSSDTHIATVQDGIVTAHSSGEVNIYVCSSKNKEVMAQCHYIVIAEETSKKKEMENHKLENVPEESPKKIKLAEKVPSSEPGTIDLGYAKYKGTAKNGKPDGAGTMIYTKRHLAGRNINNGEEVYAESGDRLEGNFSGGFLQFGTLYQQDGNVTKLKY